MTTPCSLSRRTFLRGVGVTMALPWLESLPVWGDEPTDTLPAAPTATFTPEPTDDLPIEP